MSSKVSSKKGKKPLDLPLGKAPVPKDTEVDLSHVRLPIETSIFGLNQALALFRTATSEVKRYLAYECELMYECRKCRTIFRSLANFILHKRKYCRDKHDDQTQGHKGDQIAFVQKDIEAANKIIENDISDDKEQPKRLLNPIIEKLLKKQEHAKYIQQLKNENLKDAKTEEPNTIDVLQNVVLEGIDSSNVAVFQTARPETDLGETEFMKAEVMEIHSIFEENEAAVGSDGKIITFNSRTNGENKKIKKKSLSCTECDMKFSTKKTLTYHVKYKHNNSRLVYPCPECKEVLANAWCVYRHLLKVHRKTSSQIRKYRNQIHNGAVCRKTEEAPKKDKDNAKEENDEENEWLDNFEGDNDLQMCGGCGKRFERKAALTSHSVMCTKRIAICNSIKENHAKKKESDDKDAKLKNKINRLSVKRPVGSSKRKPENLITYKPKTDDDDVDDDGDAEDVEHNTREEKEETREPEVSIEIEDSEPEPETETTKQNDDIIEPIKSEDSDQCSIRSESPCRGFVNDDTRARISPLKKLMENLRESDNNRKIEEEQEEEEGKKIEEEPEKTEDNAITLNNNNNTNENFDLVLCYNNESEDLSFGSLVKNMIDVENFDEALANETTEKNEEFTVITIVDGVSNAETSDAKTLENEENRENCKRKRDDENVDETNTKKFVHSSDSSETEDEVFVTRVNAYTDMETLSCSLCRTKFNTLSHLLLHMSIHFSWYRYQCSKCSFMSYNQYDCKSHVHKEHQLPFGKMPNMVLPIPTWKTVLISNSFINLEPINVDLPEIQPINNEKNDKIVGIIDLTSDDDSNPANNGVVEDQNMSKQAILEVILGGNERKKDGKDVICNEYSRPPRNRVKSIKTSQKDFIYDMDFLRNRTIKGNCSAGFGGSKIPEVSDQN